MEIRSRSKLVVDFMNNITKISAANIRNISEAAKLLSVRLQSYISESVKEK